MEVNIKSMLTHNTSRLPTKRDNIFSIVDKYSYSNYWEPKGARPSLNSKTTLFSCENYVIGKGDVLVSFLAGSYTIHLRLSNPMSSFSYRPSIVGPK